MSMNKKIIIHVKNTKLIIVPDNGIIVQFYFNVWFSNEYLHNYNAGFR